MADNIAVKPQTGTPGSVQVATDQIGGVHYPVYKISYGLDGSVTYVDTVSPLPTRLYGANGVEVYVDPFSGAVGVIDQEHFNIHRGRSFTVGRRFDIANGGGVVNFMGVVPAGVYPHYRKITVAIDGGPFDMDFYEDTVVSANGALVPSYNNNRNSTNAAAMLVYEGPTITTDGTLLEPVLAPGTKSEGSLGSDAANEWILKTNANSMIRITNNTPGGGTSRATVNMTWYE